MLQISPGAVNNFPYSVQGEATDASGAAFRLPPVTGHVELICDLSAEKKLQACHAASESPAGYGLATAAKRLAEDRPPSGVKAVPLTRPAGKFWADIYFGRSTVSYQYGRLPTRINITAPFFNLVEAPVIEQVAAATPSSLGEEGALIGFSCMSDLAGRLHACVVEPGGRGASDAVQAARSLLPLFRVETAGYAHAPRGIRTDLSEVRAPLLVKFSSSFRDPGIVRYVRGVDWREEAGLDDLNAAYPSQASGGGVSTGRATLDCKIAGDGCLEDCRVLSEAPSGLGFGGAAVKLAARMKANLWTREGEPAVGARIRLPLEMPAPSSAAEPKR